MVLSASACGGGTDEFTAVDADGDGFRDGIDVDGDGTADGACFDPSLEDGIDLNCDGVSNPEFDAFLDCVAELLENGALAELGEADLAVICGLIPDDSDQRSLPQP